MATIIYYVRQNWADPKTQKGAFTSLENAKNLCKNLGSNYHVFDKNGTILFTPPKERKYKLNDKVILKTDYVYSSYTPNGNQYACKGGAVIINNVSTNEKADLEGGHPYHVYPVVKGVTAQGWVSEDQIQGYATEADLNPPSSEPAATKPTSNSKLKYNDNNKPMICMMTQNNCYKGTGTMIPVGVLWHSTGANNPTLKRYVQPDDNAKNKAEMLKIIGVNPYKNDFNHIDRDSGLNAWIGLLADGTVTTIQSMPWNYKPWGCGSGINGSCNNGWIQFEICEDALTDPVYFEKVYKEACELTAYLCKKFNINPYGTVKVNGKDIPTILCHKDSHDLGMGNNHGDVMNWFPKFNKNMETVKDDVAKLLDIKKPVEAKAEDKPAATTTTQKFPYLVRITDILNVRKLPSASAAIATTIPAGGVYTIVEESNGYGLLKAYADTRNGWVNLNYTRKI